MDDFAEGYDTAARDDREEFKRLDKRIAELEAVLRELVHAFNPEPKGTETMWDRAAAVLQKSGKN